MKAVDEFYCFLNGYSKYTQVRSFLGHFEFYCRFIKDFSKIATPSCDLLANDACFYFNEDCMKAFDEFCCFFDGYFSKYNQVPIAPEDKEKTTFTGLFGTYALTRMSFVLCNAPATFQICMMTIFFGFITKIMEVV